MMTDTIARLRIDFAKDLNEHGVTYEAMGLVERVSLIEALVETALHHCGNDDE